ncbi:PorP/SprF family type IX secretion system membrane protein [Mucilaginibacter sp. HD30]
MYFDIKRLAFLIGLSIAILAPIKSRAQVNNFQSVYYQNQYLSNPAMAGLDKGLVLNFAYRQQLNSLPGSAKLQNLSADYAAGNNVGIGLIVNNEKTGLINRTRILGSYAYHLPISEDSKLHFGLSLGLNNTYLDYSAIIGDSGDQEAELFNRRPLYVDGDLGIAYTSKNLTIQGAVPNLKTVFFKDNQNQDIVTNTTIFYTAIAYKILTDNNLTFEPKLAYRGVRGFNHILDAGGNVHMPDYHLNLTGLYHSNKSISAAVGLDLSAVGLFLAFSINNSSLNQSSNNNVELGLRLKLLNNN